MPNSLLWSEKAKYEVIPVGIRKKALRYGRPTPCCKTCDAWQIWRTRSNEPV